MSYPILKGIWSTFASDATLSGAVNGMGVTLAPREGLSDVDFPYVVCHMIANTPMWTFGVTTYEQPLIQFSIYSNRLYSVSEITQIWSDLTELYDDATLSMDGYTHVMLQRGNSIGPFRVEDEDVYQMIVEYDCIVKKD